MNYHQINNFSNSVEGGLALPNGWSRIVASLLAQHSVLLQKLATATLVEPCLSVPGPSHTQNRIPTSRNREVDRRKWRNRRNRHRKKLRRLFYSARKEAQGEGCREMQVQRTLQSFISVRETHSVAEAQQQKNARLKEAFGISEYFVEGSSLDPDRKTKEEAARQAHLKQEDERRSRKHEWVSTPSPKGSPERKEKKEKKKKKKRTRDRSSSHDSSKRRKSKKSKRSR